MNLSKVNIFIQARMSSSRYPGKVLAPLKGIPILGWVVERAWQVKNKIQVVILTSQDPTDDPVAAYANFINCPVYRGDLENVFHRFQKALDVYPCDYFVRICADSPFISPSLVNSMIQKTIEGNFDLASNVMRRTFPKGQSVEVIKTSVFQSIPKEVLTPDHIEHVTPFLYQNQQRYKTLSVTLLNALNDINQCVDTLEDLENISDKQNLFRYGEQKTCFQVL